MFLQESLKIPKWKSEVVNQRTNHGQKKMDKSTVIYKTKEWGTQTLRKVREGGGEGIPAPPTIPVMLLLLQI